MARPRKNSTPVADFSLDKILGTIAAGINNPKPNNLQYEPHAKQVRFHRSETKGRQFLGGNRSGKTVAGINEDVWWATGRHPYLDLPMPTIGRIVTVDFKNGAEKIIIPQLKQWLAPSDLVNGSWEDSWNGNLHTLTLANGSEIEIMSHDQDLEKFAGVPRHWIHFDEEPPFDIYRECLARLVDYNGRWWMTMTPVEGMTWTYDEIFEKRDSPLIEVVQVDVHENPHVEDEAIDSVLASYDEEEQKIRGKGDYIAISGLVFKHFNPDSHVIPPCIPNSEDYEFYRSLDAGYNNPTAILWHAVNYKDGHIITFKEHYRSEWTVQQHAEKALADEKELRDSYGIVPFLGIADPAIKQRQQVTGLSIQIEYSQLGINWALGAKRDVNAGLDKMNNYLRLGKWYITEDCNNLIKEMRKYKRAQYATAKLQAKNNKKEEPQKKDDHAIDSTRYFFSFMPELDPKLPTPAAILRPNLLGAPVRRFPYRNVDTNLQTRAPKHLEYEIPDHALHQEEQHYIKDDYVGEW